MVAPLIAAALEKVATTVATKIGPEALNSRMANFAAARGLSSGHYEQAGVGAAPTHQSALYGSQGNSSTGTGLSGAYGYSRQEMGLRGSSALVRNSVQNASVGGDVASEESAPAEVAATPAPRQRFSAPGEQMQLPF